MESRAVCVRGCARARVRVWGLAGEHVNQAEGVCVCVWGGGGLWQASLSDVMEQVRKRDETIEVRERERERESEGGRERGREREIKG